MYMLLNLLGFFGVQRIVSPETDSGFGSSYLNQSISGSFQPNLLTERYKSIYTVTKKDVEYNELHEWLTWKQPLLQCAVPE